jgi:hypothetical protein
VAIGLVAGKIIGIGGATTLAGAILLPVRRRSFDQR